MKSVGELSSTERLLKQIRNNDPNGPEADQQSSRQLPISGLLSSLRGAFAFRSKIVVGVDIGYNDLKLMKVRQYFNREDNILAHRRIPFKENISSDSSQFTPLLRSALTNIGAASSKTEVWTIIPSNHVDRRYVKIPRVPSNQVADVVYWKYKKEVSFNDHEVVFDFEPLGDIDDDGKQKIAVMVFTAPRKEIEALTQLFSQSGFPLKGITIAPIAFQNLFRAHLLKPSENKVGILDIDMDKSRIDIFSHGNLVLSRDIKTSVSSLIEAVSQEIAAESPATVTDSESPEPGEHHTSIDFADRENAYRILFKPILDSPLIGEEEGEDLIGKDQLLRIISPVLDRLVWQVEVTSRHYASSFKTKAMEKILITGEISNSEAIVRYIGNQLGLPSERLDPFAPDIPFASDVSEPESSFEEATFASAMGIAMSNDSRTPNFIFTRKDRNRQVITKRMSRMVYSAFVLFMAFCIGISFWQQQLIVHQKAQVANLKLKIDKSIVKIDKNLILKKVARYKNQGKRLRELSERYLGLAVISELFELTPPRIRLVSLIADLSDVPGKKSKSKNKTVVVDGIVNGNSRTFEASLAEYMLRLIDSPMIETSRIEKSAVEYLGEKEVLRFMARLVLVDRNKI